MSFDNTSMTTVLQSWFIPFDILLILCTAVAIAFAIIFILMIIFNKTCHTVPMILVGNSCLAELMFGSIMLSLAVFTLHNDLRQISYQDSLCIFRGFMCYVVTALQNYSYLHQAIYRYILTIYPTRLLWQSVRCQVFLVCLIWIFVFVSPLPFLLTNSIIYNVDNQICQLPFQYSPLMIYAGLYVYMIPISLIVLIYFKLVRYVKEMSKHVAPADTIVRAQRELKMVQRIVILVVGVITIGFPYTLLDFISFFTTPPTYHFRIAYIFVDVSLVFVMIAIFKFTDPLKIASMKLLGWQANAISTAIR